MIKYKKGGEEYLSPWMFIIWGLIAVFIVAGVLIFYSVETDIRTEEADILTLRIADCIVDSGYLDEFIFEENFDVFVSCGLNKEVIEDTEDFYLYIDVFDASQPEKSLLGEPIEKGFKEFKMQCALKEASKVAHAAGCSSKKVYALSKTDSSKRFIIEIIAASNQQGVVE